MKDGRGTGGGRVGRKGMRLKHGTAVACASHARNDRELHKQQACTHQIKHSKKCMSPLSLCEWIVYNLPLVAVYLK